VVTGGGLWVREECGTQAELGVASLGSDGNRSGRPTVRLGGMAGGGCPKGTTGIVSLRGHPCHNTILRMKAPTGATSGDARGTTVGWRDMQRRLSEARWGGREELTMERENFASSMGLRRG
jgi:hypothetical protein